MPFAIDNLQNPLYCGNQNLRQPALIGGIYFFMPFGWSWYANGHQIPISKEIRNQLETNSFSEHPDERSRIGKR